MSYQHERTLLWSGPVHRSRCGEFARYELGPCAAVESRIELPPKARAPGQSRGSIQGAPKVPTRIVKTPRRGQNETRAVPDRHGSLSLAFGPYRYGGSGNTYVDVRCDCGSGIMRHHVSDWRGRRNDQCKHCVRKNRRAMVTANGGPYVVGGAEAHDRHVHAG